MEILRLLEVFCGVLANEGIVAGAPPTRGVQPLVRRQRWGCGVAATPVVAAPAVDLMIHTRHDHLLCECFAPGYHQTEHLWESTHQGPSQQSCVEVLLCGLEVLLSSS